MTTPTTVNVRLQLRADTAANWTAANPTLLANEVGLETDTKKLKVGDGSTAWASLAYFPSIVSGGTVLGNLEIGSTGTLTFEGSTANDFETTLAVTDPTADRTITLPDQSGTVVVSGNASIVDADIAANAEIAVSKLANGTANQVIVTDGTNVSWSDDLTLAGNLTVNGTTTTVNTQTLVVEDKNIELGVVGTPTDVTADGGGITLKGTTDKTINWIDSTDAWTSSERFSVPLGSAPSPSLTFTGDENTGIYSPGADQLALSTSGVQRINIEADGDINIDSGGVFYDATNNRLAIGTQTPEALLEISSASAPRLFIRATTETVGANGQLQFLTGSGASTNLNRISAITGLVEESSPNLKGALVFRVNKGDSDQEVSRIDSSGRLLVGTSSSSAGRFVVSTTTGTATMVSRQDVSSGFDESFTFIRAGGGGADVANNVPLGWLTWKGVVSGTAYTAANIQAQVDGTPGANDMPGRLVFSTTADGASSPTEAVRINAKRQLLVGTTSIGATSSGVIYATGRIASEGVYNTTTSSSANVAIISDNYMARTTSSAKYKTDIETLEDSYADAILKCRPVWYKSFGTIDNPDWGYWGFIAEEVAAIDPRLVQWKTVEVTHDENGGVVQTPCDPEPESVQYDRFVPHLLNLIKRQKEQIETQGAAIAVLEAKVAALETP